MCAFICLFILLLVYLFAQLDLSSNAFVRVTAAPVAHIIWMLQCVAVSHELNARILSCILRRTNPLLYFALQCVAVCTFRSCSCCTHSMEVMHSTQCSICTPPYSVEHILHYVEGYIYYIL